MKVVLKGKFIALNTCRKKLEKFHTSEPTEHLRALEQKEANAFRRTRGQKIIKLIAEINKIKTKESMRQKR